jgi:hypothetical protein
MVRDWNTGRAFEGGGALSPAGEARREAILQALKTEVVRRRRRRAIFRRAALAAAACMVLAGIAIDRHAAAPRSPEGPLDAVREEASVPRPLVLANARLETVRDASGILERVAIRDRPIPASTFTDDEGLLASLTAAERPAGLVRFEGGMVLAYHGSSTRLDAGSSPR